MLSVTINGAESRCGEGATILDALHRMNIEVPTLCHDDRLKPYGGCRLCLVSVKGHARPLSACDTPLAAGMEIETHTPEIEELRRTQLALLTQSYPSDAVERFPGKPFHRWLKAYGLEKECRGGAGQQQAVDDSHPYIHVDMSRCIACYRCVRICEELQGQFVWKVWNRGDQTRIVPDSGTTLKESSCVSCGACVDTCPTGALEDQTLIARGVPTAWTRTTCPYCGTGCEMNAGTRDGRIVQVQPVLDAPVNRGHLCVKGRYAFDFGSAPDRITWPMTRRNGEWKRVSWDYAIGFVGEALKETIEEHGPESVGMLGSARATNEENYLAQKFARVVLGTNNVDCCARVCHAPTAAAMKAVLGTGASTNSFDDIERARTILIAGANPTSNHPIVGARIKQAVLQGARLIVIDPRKIELAQYAECHLQLRPGTNVPLLNAMAQTILEEDLCDREFLRERVAEWKELQAFLRDFSPEKVASICDLKAEDIRKAARLYAKEKPSLMIHGLGMTEHTQGTDGVMLLVNLALLTGNLGKRGTGVNPLRGQNNVQGSAHMGCEPKSLTGAVSIADGKELFENVWKSPLPTTAGLNLMEMLDATKTDKFKALWTIGYDLYLTNPNSAVTREALRSMDFVIVQDLFLNETAREFGSVFLPAASPFEKDGTFMNAERRIQRVRKAIEPPGQAKSDWEILCLAARAMGWGELFSYRSAEEIWNEIRTVWKAGAGITYPRIEKAGLQWPCPEENHPGTEMLHTAASAQPFALRRVEFRPSPERTNLEFPFLLNTGRTAYHFNAGTMTMRTPNRELWPADLLEISPRDAARLGLKEGDWASIESRYGEAALQVKLTDTVKTGELFATFHTATVFLNDVIGPHRDGVTKTPEYKLTAVRVQKIKGSSGGPPALSSTPSRTKTP